MRVIRAAIFAGDYTPGQRMVEEDLAGSLGVSRNVVREAFWQLEAQGLLQSDDYKGKSVAALNSEEMVEMIPLRMVMESLAATSAARRITPEAAKALRRQAERFSTRLTRFSSYAEIDFELHQMIWQLSGSKRMSQMLDRISGPMIALQARVYQPLLDDLVQKEIQAREGSHRAIVDAICAGAAGQARRSMQTHILAFWQMWLGGIAGEEEVAPDSSRAIEDSIALLESLCSVFPGIA